MRIEITCLAAGHSARPVTPTWTGLAALVMPTKPLTEAALCDWIAQAPVGQSLQYHEGLLMVGLTAGTTTATGK